MYDEEVFILVPKSIDIFLFKTVSRETTLGIKSKKLSCRVRQVTCGKRDLVQLLKLECT